MFRIPYTSFYLAHLVLHCLFCLPCHLILVTLYPSLVIAHTWLERMGEVCCTGIQGGQNDLRALLGLLNEYAFPLPSVPTGTHVTCGSWRSSMTCQLNSPFKEYTKEH